MKLMERIRRIIPKKPEPVVVGVDLAVGASRTVTVEMTGSPLGPVVVDEIEDNGAPETKPKAYQIPVNPGEYFPWKGHVFKVVTAGPMCFTAECVGITKNRATKLGVR